MFNVLIDTCVWLDLADKPQQTALMSPLEGLLSYGARLEAHVIAALYCGKASSPGDGPARAGVRATFISQETATK
jgi:hypothetical protein